MKGVRQEREREGGMDEEVDRSMQARELRPQTRMDGVTNIFWVGRTEKGTEQRNENEIEARERGMEGWFRKNGRERGMSERNEQKRAR